MTKELLSGGESMELPARCAPLFGPLNPAAPALFTALRGARLI